MANTSKHDLYPEKTFPSAASFLKWLAANHAKADGLWIKIAKAGTGIKSISYSEAIESALCYGWIDGLRRRVDEIYFVQKFTPRRTGSIWSDINKKKVAELIKSGRMQPAGLAAIEAAKVNGRWDSAYNSQKSIAIPEQFQKALNANKKAKKFFEGLSSQNRYAILFRIGQVKKEETRKKKIEEYVAMLERNETIYPQ